MSSKSIKSKASSTGKSHAKSHSSYPSSGRTSRSSKSSTRLAQEAIMHAAVKKVELKCKLEALRHKHQLDEEESKLQMQVEGVHRRKERLEMEAALYAEEAKLEVLQVTVQGASDNGSHADLDSVIVTPAAAPPGFRVNMDKMSAVEGWLNKQHGQDVTSLEPVGTDMVHHNVERQDVRGRGVEREEVERRSVADLVPVGAIMVGHGVEHKDVKGQDVERQSVADLVPVGAIMVGHGVEHKDVKGQNVQRHDVEWQHERHNVGRQDVRHDVERHDVERQDVRYDVEHQDVKQHYIEQPIHASSPAPHDSSYRPAKPKHEVPSVSQCGTAEDWLIKQEEQSVASGHQVNLMGLLIKQQNRACLPQRDIKRYDGDPLAFANFMTAFKYTIEQKTTDDKERLYFLVDYTTGEPRRLVESFLNREKGYEEAKAVLQKKFGNRFVIANAFREKAEAWPMVKRDDERAWNKFSIFLIEYQNIMIDMKHMDEIDHSAFIKVLLGKIPYSARNQWRIYVDRLMESEDRCPGFQDFVTFIERQTRIICNPIYGNIEDQNKNRDSRSQKPKVRSAYATATTQSGDKWCAFCESSTHSLEVCRKLNQKPHKDRIEFLKTKGMCFSCLRKGQHMSKDCKAKLKCSKCSGNHPSVLHIERKSSNQAKEAANGRKTESSIKKGASTTESSKNTMEKASSAATSCRLTGAGFASTTQLILPVIVRSKVTGESLKTNVMLDDGSDAVFCTERLRNKLGIRGTRTKLHVSTMTGDEVMETRILADLEVVSIDGENSIKLPVVYTTSDIPADATHYPVTADLKPWPYLHEVELPEIEGEVDLLIGSNAPRAMEPWKVIHSIDGGPFACKTLLGWTIHGLMKDTDNVSAYRIMVKDREIKTQLQEMYNADFPEKLIEDEEQLSREDELFMKMVKGSLKHDDDGHYEIGLPIKEENCVFPNNRPLAEQRLAHLQRKFLRSGEEYRTDYTAFIEDMLAKGYAEKIPEAEIECSHNRRWYIPHHSVYHPQKQKIRVVFDCAATYHGVSLNNKLLQGPNQTNSLVGVIVRFRQEPIAMMADIKSMYHQVRVRQGDRDLLRFLWWPGGDTNNPIGEYRMKAHLFGARSSPACANFALHQTARDNSSKYNHEAVETVHNNFYVDDCLKSASNEAKAIRLAQDLKSLCADGGFHLTKWVSNSRKVIGSIPEEDRASGVKTLDFQDALPMERALGVLWCPETDSFAFNVQVKDKPATRRGILSIVSSVYDPLGFVSPVILPAKRILQDLCKIQLSWDEEIPQIYRLQWDQWLKSISAISGFTIPRHYVPTSNFGNPSEVQLHHFSDASELGYGVVSYLRFINQDGDIHCMLVCSKSRVTPLKQVTIPRLELTAATLAVKVNYQLQKELNFCIDSTYFWSDSTTTLQYIQSDTKRFKTFVANRLAIIRDGSQPSQWRYVNTSMNPADESSRGLTVDKFLQNDRWLRGPPFLWNQEHMWPQAEPLKASSEDDPEIKKVAVQALQVNACPDATDRLLEYHSSWYNLRRAVAWILKVKQKLLSRINHRRQDKQTEKEEPEASQLKDDGSNTLSHKDLQYAEKAIIRYIQHTSFAREIAVLQGNHGNESIIRKQQVVKSSPLHRLDPQLVDGVLRVGGRLRKAAIPEESKHPCILPKNCHVTYLILQEIHQTHGHVGRSYMLSQFRRKYWAASANAMCRSIIGKCVTCRKQYRKAESQRMADLPADRVLPNEPPFTGVGMDFFGPVEVKQGRSMVKRYGVVFTCLAVRAVHIEKADSLDTDSCIAAIRRFIARRGQVQLIRSDNGSNIVGAQREMRREIDNWNQVKISDTLLQKNIEWKFNPPAGSNFGGVWERQIRTIRKVLMSVVKEQVLTDEGLCTLLCEVEAIVNGRPLTKASADPWDIEALTPNHLLLMKGKPALPPAITSSKDQYLRRRWKQIQYLADLFWRRWTREYLPQLQERQKWCKLEPNVQEGDVVLVIDNSQPRGSWPMGKVEQTMPDSHGQVRVVKVKTKAGMFIRPVNKLITLLECDAAPTNQPVMSDTEASQMDITDTSKAKKGADANFSKLPAVNKTRTRIVKPRERLDL